MERNTGQDAATPIPDLAHRVRAARLPTPGERTRIRQVAGVTLRHVAAQLGVTPMTVSRWERGTAKPPLERREAYASLLRDIEAAAAAGDPPERFAAGDRGVPPTKENP